MCEVQGKEFKGFVQSVGANPVIIPYSVATVGDIAGVTDDSNQTIKLFVYGSEFKKGTAGMAEAVEPGFKTFTNKPITINEHFNSVNDQPSLLCEPTRPPRPGGHRSTRALWLRL